MTDFNTLAEKFGEYWNDEYNERAAIIQLVEGETQDKAERLAYVQTRARMQAVSRAVIDHQQRVARDKETFGR